MYQCILNVPLWNDWIRVIYSQVHGSPAPKALLFESFQWIYAAEFADLITKLSEKKINREIKKQKRIIKTYLSALP